MAWSTWQSPFRADLQGVPQFYTWDTVNGDGPDAGQSPGSFRYGESRVNVDAQIITNGAIWSSPTGWADYREKYPPALDALEEGVDYDVIPGKNRWDDDAFVEYAAEPNVWDGWGAPAQTGYVTTSTDPGDPWEGTGRITLLVPGGTEQTWATWTAHEPGEPIGSMPNPGNVDTFTIRAHYTISTGLNGSAFASFVYAHMRLTLPQWRYWIPDAAVVYPLRQKQRNDGLARGVLRARSTSSIQNSVRQNSYR